MPHENAIDRYSEFFQVSDIWHCPEEIVQNKRLIQIVFTDWLTGNVLTPSSQVCIYGMKQNKQTYYQRKCLI